MIAAGKPIEAIEDVRYMSIPDEIKTDKPCYVLKVKGDSMIEEGIYDGDWVIIEQRCHARNGEIVVALVDKAEATLKFIEQYPHEILLIPANAKMEAMHYQPAQVEIQGVAGRTNAQLSFSLTSVIKTWRATMKQKIHMHDRVFNKVEDIMNHYKKNPIDGLMRLLKQFMKQSSVI